VPNSPHRAVESRMGKPSLSRGWGGVASPVGPNSAKRHELRRGVDRRTSLASDEPRGRGAHGIHTRERGVQRGHTALEEAHTEFGSVPGAESGLRARSGRDNSTEGVPDHHIRTPQLKTPVPTPPPLLPPPPREGLRVYDNRFDPIPRYDDRALRGY